jgi:hypothetical protein
MNIYYIYFYLRTDGTPYYIGKGKGSRAYFKHGRRVAVPPKGLIIFPIINLTEEQAFSNEKDFIAWYGRKDLGTGILRNMTDGGEGSSNPSKETRRKISEAHKGKVLSEKARLDISKRNSNPSEETRRKMRKAHKHGQPNLGRTLSEETKRKMSESRKLYWISKKVIK